MGKKSVKENKNIYQQKREALNLSREAASEQMKLVSADRIEKIENEKSNPHPDEILAMAQCYQAPELCNYYCSHTCPIGIEHVPALEEKELPQIALEVLASLNALEKRKERLIEISMDGKISKDQKEDFTSIKEELDFMSNAIQSLSLWLEKNQK